MEAWNLQPGALDGIDGGVLFYPAAGGDWPTFLDAFWDCVDEFVFCDLHYDLDRVSADEAGFKVIQSGLIGAARARVDPAIPDRPWREVEPGVLAQQIEPPAGGLPRQVRFRRGFGQYGLWEMAENSVSVFVHRGDSQGEGGSNVWFFSNRKGRHAPVSNLFSTLVGKLRNPCLVISDGSNTNHPVLRRFNWKSESGEEAVAHHGGRAFEYGGFSWRCVGHGGRRYGPTLVWRLTREDD